LRLPPNPLPSRAFDRRCRWVPLLELLPFHVTPSDFNVSFTNHGDVTGRQYLPNHCI
jgi:hypothetical protein